MTLIAVALCSILALASSVAGASDILTVYMETDNVEVGRADALIPVTIHTYKDGNPIDPDSLKVEVLPQKKRILTTLEKGNVNDIGRFEGEVPFRTGDIIYDPVIGEAIHMRAVAEMGGVTSTFDAVVSIADAFRIRMEMDPEEPDVLSPMKFKASITREGEGLEVTEQDFTITARSFDGRSTVSEVLDKSSYFGVVEADYYAPDSGRAQEVTFNFQGEVDGLPVDYNETFQALIYDLWRNIRIDNGETIIEFWADDPQGSPVSDGTLALIATYSGLNSRGVAVTNEDYTRTEDMMDGKAEFFLPTDGIDSITLTGWLNSSFGDQYFSDEIRFSQVKTNVDGFVVVPDRPQIDERAIVVNDEVRLEFTAFLDRSRAGDQDINYVIYQGIPTVPGGILDAGPVTTDQFGFFIIRFEPPRNPQSFITIRFETIDDNDVTLVSNVTDYSFRYEGLDLHSTILEPGETVTVSAIPPEPGNMRTTVNILPANPLPYTGKQPAWKKLGLSSDSDPGVKVRFRDVRSARAEVDYPLPTFFSSITKYYIEFSYQSELGQGWKHVETPKAHFPFPEDGGVVEENCIITCIAGIPSIQFGDSTLSILFIIIPLVAVGGIVGKIVKGGADKEPDVGLERSDEFDAATDEERDDLGLDEDEDEYHQGEEEEGPASADDQFGMGSIGEDGGASQDYFGGGAPAAGGDLFTAPNQDDGYGGSPYQGPDPYNPYTSEGSYSDLPEATQIPGQGPPGYRDGWGERDANSFAMPGSQQSQDPRFDPRYDAGRDRGYGPGGQPPVDRRQDYPPRGGYDDRDRDGYPPRDQFDRGPPPGAAPRDQYGGPPPAQGQGGGSSLIRCHVCDQVIPIPSRERPLTIVCPSCGAKGILRE